MVYRLLSVLRVHGRVLPQISKEGNSTTMAARIGDAAVVAELETALGSGNAARAGLYEMHLREESVVWHLGYGLSSE